LQDGTLMPPRWRRNHHQRSIDKFLANLHILIDKFVVCAAGVLEEDPHIGAEGVESRSIRV
jgi:hypothetical protein